MIATSLIYLIKPIQPFYFIMTGLLWIVFFIQKEMPLMMKDFKPHNFHSFLIILLFSIIGFYKAPSTSEGMIYFTRIFFIPFTLVTIFSNIKLEFRKIKLFYSCIVVVAFVVSLIGVYLAITNPEDRIGSTWVTAMTINAFYLIAFYLSLALYFEVSKKTVKVIFIVMAFIIFLGILFTYTRMALLGIAFGLGLASLKVKELRKYFIFFAVLGFILIPATLLMRFSKGIFEDTSMIIRYLVWEKSINLIIESPITGIGFETLKYINKMPEAFSFLYAEHSHNVFLRLALEIGVIGMLAYNFVIFRNLYLYYKIFKNRMLYYFTFVALLTIMFTCLTDVFIIQTPIAFLFWSLMGIVINQIINKEEFIELSS